MDAFCFIDLFAGLGGFHVALGRLGGRCVYAAEWKAGLKPLYERNFGLAPAGDISLVDPRSIPAHDVLTAGFPCQPFSKAGEQLGFECTKQGGLFFDVAAILKEKRPSLFILENVPNLLKHDGGRTWESIRRILSELGYQIEAKQLSPHHFGIPQIRERVYIIGSRVGGLDGFRWPLHSEAETTIESVLDARPPDAKPLSGQIADCLTVWDDFLNRSPKSMDFPWHPMWSMEWGATYPFEDETPYARWTSMGGEGLQGYKGSHGKKIGYLRDARDRWMGLPSHARTPQMQFPKWKRDFIRLNRKFYADNRAWIDPWMPRILDFPSSLQKLEFNVKGGRRTVWDYVVQFRASGVRVKRRATAPSLIAMTDTQVPIIAWERRFMTPRECARLQSLPEDHALPESSSQAFAALGNAVNVKVVEAVARSLIEATGVGARAGGASLNMAEATA